LFGWRKAQLLWCRCLGQLGLIARACYTNEFGPLVRNAALGLAGTSAKAFALNDSKLLNNLSMRCISQ
jgi:hypothetical protein